MGRLLDIESGRNSAGDLGVPCRVMAAKVSLRKLSRPMHDLCRGGTADFQGKRTPLPLAPHLAAVASF